MDDVIYEALKQHLSIDLHISSFSDMVTVKVLWDGEVIAQTQDTLPETNNE